MSEQSKIERPYQDGSWHWVKYEGLHKEYGAPAMYKANCDAWYSFEFSGIPTRQVEVLGPCVNASLPVGVPDGWRPVPVESLTRIARFIDPAPVRLPNGDTMVFKNPHAAGALREISAEFRAMLAAAPTVKAEQGTTGDQYRAELYDEVWQTARDMGYGNVTDALVELERLKQAPSLPAAGSDCYAVAEQVRTALDRHACPNAWMVIAYEAVVAALSAQQTAPERVSVPVASGYPKVGWTKRHKHTCANVQPGATSANKCDCGAVEQDKSREAIERAIHLLQANAPSMGCAEWDAAEDLRALLSSHGRGEA